MGLNLVLPVIALQGLASRGTNASIGGLVCGGAMAEVWFRNKTWSPEIEANFFKKLRRGRSQGPQNLVIQAALLKG
jgi:hypothetical protein